MMKKNNFAVLSLWGVVVTAFLSANHLALAVDVGKWKRFETAFNNNSWSGNPFDLEFRGTFTHASSGRTLQQWGFYAGNNTWKIYFMPDRLGEWTFQTQSTDSDLNGRTGSFNCVDSGLPGLLQGDGKHWKLADGPCDYPILWEAVKPGEPWAWRTRSATDPVFIQINNFARDVVGARVIGGNVLVFNNIGWASSYPQNALAYVIGQEGDYFNLTFWDRLNAKLDITRDSGMGVYIMFFSDDEHTPDVYGITAQSQAEYRLFKYAIARLACYPIVIWDSGIDISEYRSDNWIEWFVSWIKNNDPWKHPIDSRSGGGSGGVHPSIATYYSYGFTGDGDSDIPSRSDLITDFNNSSVPIAYTDHWRPYIPRGNWGHDAIRRVLWRVGLSGAMCTYIDYNTGTPDQAGVELGGEYVGNASRFFRNDLVNGVELFSPRDHRINYCSQGTKGVDVIMSSVAAEEFVLYTRYGGNVSIDMSNATGNFNVSWYNPRTGDYQNASTVTGGGSRSFSAPGSGDYVLHIYQGTELDPPDNLSAHAVSFDQIDLSWNDNAANEYGYKIERRDQGQSGFNLIASIGSDAENYSDRSLFPSTTYTYRVYAFRNEQISPYSNESEATTAEQPDTAIYEAEQALLAGPAVGNAISGYTGTGYADYMTSSGEYIEWTVFAPVAGSYELRFRYALGSGDRPLAISVNGQIVDASLPFPATGGWAVWNYSWLNTGLAAGTNRIRAASIGYSGANVDHLMLVNLNTSPPAAPGNLDAIAVSHDTIQLQWVDNAIDETGFVILRYKGTTLDETITIEVPDTSAYTDTGLDYATTYCYYVYAWNAQGDSELSYEDCETTFDPPPPPAPDNLAAVATENSIELIWNPVSPTDPPLDYYRVYRSLQPDGPLAVYALVTTGTQYVDTDVTQNTTCYYAVTAVDTWPHESGFSNQVQATLLPVVLETPTALIALQTDHDQITLAWQDNTTEESGYRIERRLGTGNYQQVGQTGENVTQWVDHDIACDSNYTYRVYAWNEQVNSDYSNESIVTTNDCSTWQVIYEAEDAELAGPIVGNTFTGYTGSGYVDFLALSGEVVRWTVHVDTSDDYQIAFRYALGNGDRPLQIRIDDQILVDSMSFPGTGGWLDWSEVVLQSVSLSYGFHTVELIGIGYSGGNIDSLILRGGSTGSLAPNPPTGLVAQTTGTDSIHLEWTDNSDNEQGFRIERTPTGGNFNMIRELPAESGEFDDTGLTPGTEYQYRVLAFNTTGVSDYSNVAASTTEYPPLTDVYEAEYALLAGPVVDDLIAGYTGTGYIDFLAAAGEFVEWQVLTPVAGHYQLAFRYALGNGDRPLQFIVNGQVVAAGLNFPGTGSWSNWETVETSADFISGTNTVRLVGIGYSGANIDHLQITGGSIPMPPAAPGSLTALADGPDRISLAWQDNANNEEGFILHRRSGSDDFQVIAVIGQNVENYNDLELSYATSYTYRIRAFNAHGGSAFSNEADAVTSPPLPPPAPAELAAEPGQGSVHLTWSAITTNGPELDYYKVYRSNISGSQFEPIAVVTDQTEYTDSDVTPDTTCYYVVTAVDVWPHESVWSDEVQAAPLPVPFTEAIYEAEDAQLVGTTCCNLIDGYTGTGYVDFLASSGESIRWTIQIDNNSYYQIAFRYALGNGDRPLQVSLDGQVIVPTMSFPGTGGWANWSEVCLDSVSLSQGTHTIRIEAIGYSGGNIDSLIIRSGEPGEIPASPQSLVGNATGTDSIRLQWTDASQNEDGFRIERSVQGGSYQWLCDVDADSIHYDDHNLTADSVYGYRILAFNSSGQSDFSNEVMVRTDAVSVLAVYEAEDALLAGPVFDNTIPGYTGSGYVDYQADSGEYVEWQINVPISGFYTFRFQYALGNGDRPLQIRVDGLILEPALAFTNTGGWYSWGNTSTAGYLTGGSHTIRAESIGYSGANIDSLSVLFGM